MEKSKYHPGDYLVICDMCGFEKLRSQCVFNWKKQLVCKDTCYEPRHPQEFVKVRPEKTSVPDARPEAADSFLSMGEVTIDDL